MKRNNKTKTKQAKPVFYWKASQNLHSERGSKWIIYAIFASLLLVFWGIYTGAWTFSLVVIAFSFTYYITNKEKDKNIDVEILDEGIKVENRFYSFHNIKSFWIIYVTPKIQLLHFTVKGDVWGEVKVNMNGQNLIEIQKFLSEKVPEITDKHESFTDTILRLLKI